MRDIWKLRPILAIPLFSLFLAAILASASLLSEFIKKGTWTTALSTWPYRSWEAAIILVGCSTVLTTGAWIIQRAFAKRKKLRPILAIPIFSLGFAAIIALSTLLVGYFRQGSWTMAFSVWIYRRWDVAVILVGSTTAMTIGIWVIQRRMSAKR